jgi:hypothetical protein
MIYTSRRFQIILLVALALPLSAQRLCCQGDWWLKWSQSTREAYVFAYSLGYSEGHADGCNQTTKHLPAAIRTEYGDAARNKCTDEGLDFTKGSEYFANNITQFYKQYPKDKDIYIEEVLKLLAKGLTIEEIHNYPFPRHEK